AQVVFITDRKSFYRARPIMQRAPIVTLSRAGQKHPSCSTVAGWLVTDVPRAPRLHNLICSAEDTFSRAISGGQFRLQHQGLTKARADASVLDR
ncbi:hypothetical protein RRG08_065903, partial [Elysia crispata]